MKMIIKKRPQSAKLQHKMRDELKINDIAEKISQKISPIKEINIKLSRRLNIPHAQLNNAEEIRSNFHKPFWLKDYSKKQGIQILPNNMEYNASSYIRNNLNKKDAKEKNEKIIEDGTNIKDKIDSLEKRINSKLDEKFNKLDNKLDEKFGEMYNVMASGFDWIISYLNNSIPPRNKSFSGFKEIKIENNNFKIKANSEKDEADKKMSDSGNKVSGDVSYNSNEQVEQSNLINDSHKFYSKNN